VINRIFGQVLGRVTLATPYGNTGCLPQSNPTKSRKLGVEEVQARCRTLAMLNIEPREPKNSGSNADDPINSAHLLGMLHIVDLIC
jgi:hypothetical protein